MVEEILEDICCYKETAERVKGGQMIRLYQKMPDSTLKLVSESFDSDADSFFAKRENLAAHYTWKNKIWNSNHIMNVGGKTVKTKHGENRPAQSEPGANKTA
jgi:hypothetical protein